MQGFSSLKFYWLINNHEGGWGKYPKNNVEGLLPGKNRLGLLEKSLE